MAKLLNVLITVLTEKEQSEALKIVAANGDYSKGPVYIRGFATEDDCKKLESMNILVEREVSSDVKWLKPTAKQLQKDKEIQASELVEAGFNLASDETGTGDSLRELKASAPKVVVLSLKNQLRSAWRATLEKLGLKVLGTKNKRSFKVSIPRDQMDAVRNLEFVADVEEISVARREEYFRQMMDHIETIEEEQKGGTRGFIAESADALKVGRAIAAATVEAAPPIEEPSLAGIDTSPEVTARETDLRTFEIKCQQEQFLDQVHNILSNNSEVTNLSKGRVKLRFDCKEDAHILSELMSMTDVVSQPEPYLEPELLNDFAAVDVGARRPDVEADFNYKGKGQIIGVADSGVDQSHPDLTDAINKVIQLGNSDPSDPIGHGTHVCGTICGRGVVAKALAGVAPEAELFVQAVFDSNGRPSGLPVDLYDLFKEAYDNGVRIHNNSWGQDAEARYLIQSDEVDNFVYEHPDFLVIFAAGNTGRQSDQPDDGGRIRNGSLNAPASAKNCLSVGASSSSRTDGPFVGKKWNDYPRNAPKDEPLKNEPIYGDVEVLAPFSSRGPTTDGRIKPDLVAPGTAILSSRSEAHTPRYPYQEFDGRYMYLFGTSMAAPVVAGAAAVLRQYLQEKRDCRNPSAALMKAALINSTKWISKPAVVDSRIGNPNHHQGFGRLDLRRLIPSDRNESGFRFAFVDVAKDSDLALKREIAERAKFVRAVDVGTGAPLSITLAWTDRPRHGLQQNLDLVVVTPDGTKIVGNSGLVRDQFDTTDDENNVERVYIEDPIEGTYVMQVLPYETPFEQQGFGLVVSGKLSSDQLLVT